MHHWFIYFLALIGGVAVTTGAGFLAHRLVETWKRRRSAHRVDLARRVSADVRDVVRGTPGDSMASWAVLELERAVVTSRPKPMDDLQSHFRDFLRDRRYVDDLFEQVHKHIADE